MRLQAPFPYFGGKSKVAYLVWEGYRIVLAGYEEHDSLLAHGWTAQQWTASGGYANLGSGKNKRNRYREVLYFSPGCQTRTLFDHLSI